jgi:hypothetical protein
MRKFSLVLVALGAFLIVLSPMVRFYAYPKIAVAPVNQNSITTLVGPDATIFDISSLKEIQTDLTTKVRTIGDSKASEKAPGNTVVCVSSTETKSSDGVMRSSEVERVAFDANTAKAVNCCDEFISETKGEETPVKHEGLLVKFPFHTEKKTYDFWDGSLLKAVPIQYKGTEDLDGLTVYKFEHTIEPTKVGEQDLPLSLLGLEGDETVTADSMYSNTRTLWVEPNTGVIIKRAEAQNNTFDYEGEPRITTTKVTTGYDDATVAKNIKDYKSLGSQLHLLRSTVPLVCLILGLVLLVLGLVLAGRNREPRRAD